MDQFGCQRRNAALVHRVARLTAAHRTSSSAGTSSSPTGTDTPAKYIFFSIFLFGEEEVLTNFCVLFGILGGEVLPVHGEGPSSEALHLGHLIPFMFTK